MDEKLFAETGGDLFKSYWGPVRINGQGTVELRSLDSNYPDITLAVAALIHATAERVRDEKLSVTPDPGTETFAVAGDRLLVPGFEYLSRDLFHAATTGGVKDPAVVSYLDSIWEFAAPYVETAGYLETLKSTVGSYQTTEEKVLQEFPATEGFIAGEDGLRLVRESCDALEEQVASMLGDNERSNRVGTAGKRF